MVATGLYALWSDGNASPLEFVWAAMGAGGLVYAADIWKRRMDQKRFLQRTGHDPLGIDQIQAHVVLRGCGVLLQLLVLLSGLSSMQTPPAVRDVVQAHEMMTAYCVIGMGVLVTFSSWYAEHAAHRQANRIMAARAERAILERQLRRAHERLQTQGGDDVRGPNA